MSAGYKTIAIDAIASVGFQNNVSSISFSISIGNHGNRILSVVVPARGAGTSVSGITANGLALTLRKASTQFDQNYCEIWDLVNPSTGVNNIVITFVGTPDATAGAISMYNANVGSPIDVTGQDTRNGNPSTALSVTLGGSMAIDGFWSANNSSLTVGAGQTQVVQSVSNDAGGVSYKSVNAGANTMSWSNNGSNSVSQAAVVYKPARVTAGGFLLNFI